MAVGTGRYDLNSLKSIKKNSEDTFANGNNIVSSNIIDENPGPSENISRTIETVISKENWNSLLGLEV